MKLWPFVLFVAIACDARLDLGHDQADAPDGGTDAPGADAAAADHDDDDASSSTADSSCADVCSRVIACGILAESDRAECLARCNAGSTSADRACIMQSSCSSMVTACGIPSDGAEQPDDAGDPQEQFHVQVCQDSCDQAHFMGCIDSPAHAACREHCTTAASGPRESFTACMDTASGGDCSGALDCVDQFSN